MEPLQLCPALLEAAVGTQKVAALALVTAWLCPSERGLSLVLFGVTQEEFLSRLMMFGSAGVVDSVCHLNGWERCSIPIHALEVRKAASCLANNKLCISSTECGLAMPMWV